MCQERPKWLRTVVHTCTMEHTCNSTCNYNCLFQNYWKKENKTLLKKKTLAICTLKKEVGVTSGATEKFACSALPAAPIILPVSIICNNLDLNTSHKYSESHKNNSSHLGNILRRLSRFAELRVRALTICLL